MRSPFLVGTQLYLRPLEESDLNETYCSWLNDPEVTRYLGIGRFPSTIASIRRYLERFENSNSHLILAIIDRESDRHIGNITLNRIHWIHRTADTGILIGAKEFWGRGYAFEAWGLLIDHAFRNLNLHKIIAGAIQGHASSHLVLEKIGFKVEGTLREEYFIDGQYRDVVRMGLFQEAFYRAMGEASSRPCKDQPSTLKV